MDRLEKLELYPFTAEALKTMKSMGFYLVLITNQSGVARGFFSEDMVKKVHHILQERLRKEGVELDGIYFCPHHPSITGPCSCRKPETGLVERACKDLGIEPKASYVIGDKWSDVELGKRVGAKAILVLTGYGLSEVLKGNHKLYRPDAVVENLLDAAKIIKRMEEADDIQGAP